MSIFIAIGIGGWEAAAKNGLQSPARSACDGRARVSRSAADKAASWNDVLILTPPIRLEGRYLISRSISSIESPAAEAYLGSLAAGPVEALLSYHGERFIDRVELAARSDPNFAYAGGRLEIQDDR
jgi:hypothetical protein